MGGGMNLKGRGFCPPAASTNNPYLSRAAGQRLKLYPAAG